MLFGFGVFAATLAENSFGVFRRQRQMEAKLNALKNVNASAELHLEEGDHLIALDSEPQLQATASALS
jgi:hypothetical protein